MALLGELAVKVNYEMTDTSKAVLRNEFLKLLQEPEVLKVLLEAIEERVEQDIKLGAGMSRINPPSEPKRGICNEIISDSEGHEIARAKEM